jgi:DNA-binding transcriptional LysR family regulator
VQRHIRAVETGGFSKASAGLGITQSTASEHVAALEAGISARLVHRSKRGVTPTARESAHHGKCKLNARELETPITRPR